MFLERTSIRYLKIDLHDSAHQGWRAARILHRCGLYPAARAELRDERAYARAQRRGVRNVESTNWARGIGLPVARSPHGHDRAPCRRIRWSVERPVLVDCRSLRRLPDLQPENPRAAEYHLRDRRSELLIVVSHRNLCGVPFTVNPTGAIALICRDCAYSIGTGAPSNST